jgi:NADPH:quinone reductase-like Zn-dependent oxidoreductase
VSGVVETVAHGVTDVSIGDAVYALTSFCRDGAAAERGVAGHTRGKLVLALRPLFDLSA